MAALREWLNDRGQQYAQASLTGRAEENLEEDEEDPVRIFQATMHELFAFRHLCHQYQRNLPQVCHCSDPVRYLDLLVELED